MVMISKRPARLCALLLKQKSIVHLRTEWASLCSKGKMTRIHLRRDYSFLAAKWRHSGHQYRRCAAGEEKLVGYLAGGLRRPARIIAPLPVAGETGLASRRSTSR